MMFDITSSFGLLNLRGYSGSFRMGVKSSHVNFAVIGSFTYNFFNKPLFQNFSIQQKKELWNQFFIISFGATPFSSFFVLLKMVTAKNLTSLRQSCEVLIKRFASLQWEWKMEEKEKVFFPSILYKFFFS